MTDPVYYPDYRKRERLVHILDADAGTCEALSVLFRLEGFQTAFSVEAAGFLLALSRRRPDVAIINIRVGNDDGVALLKRVKALHDPTPVFIVEDQPEVDLAVTAIRAGASDVLTKPIDSDRLVRAVRDAIQHDIRFDMPSPHWNGTQLRGFGQLTPREREVLQLIASGHSNKEAGRRLGISPRTIEVHRARVMEKLGARNTADLIRIVLTNQPI